MAASSFPDDVLGGGAIAANQAGGACFAGGKILATVDMTRVGVINTIYAG